MENNGARIVESHPCNCYACGESIMPCPQVVMGAGLGRLMRVFADTILWRTRIHKGTEYRKIQLQDLPNATSMQEYSRQVVRYPCASNSSSPLRRPNHCLTACPSGAEFQESTSCTTAEDHDSNPRSSPKATSISTYQKTSSIRLSRS